MAAFELVADILWTVSILIHSRIRIYSRQGSYEKKKNQQNQYPHIVAYITADGQ